MPREHETKVGILTACSSSFFTLIATWRKYFVFLPDKTVGKGKGNHSFISIKFEIEKQGQAVPNLLALLCYEPLLGIFLISTTVLSSSV